MISIETKTTRPQSSLAAAVERARSSKRSYYPPIQHTLVKVTNVERIDHYEESCCKNQRSSDHTTKQINRSSLAAAVAIAAERTNRNSRSHYHHLQPNTLKQGDEKKTKNFCRKNNNRKFVDRIAKQDRSHEPNSSTLTKENKREQGLVTGGQGNKQVLATGGHGTYFRSGQSGRTGRGRGRNANRVTIHRGGEKNLQRAGNCDGEIKALQVRNGCSRGETFVVVTDAKNNEEQRVNTLSDDISNEECLNVATSRHLPEDALRVKVPIKSQNFENCTANVQNENIIGGVMHYSGSESIFEGTDSEVITGKVTTCCELSPIRGRWADESDGDY